MSNVSPETAIKIWKPLYLHFTTKYDCFKAGSRVKFTKKEIDKRIPQLYRFSKIFNNKLDASFFLIANYLDGNFNVPFEISKNELDTYFSWRGRRESITYNFKNEFQLFLDNELYKDLSLKNYPHNTQIFKYYQDKRISAETLILIDKYYLPLLDDWLADDIENLFYGSAFRLIKYKPFVRHNENKIKGVINSMI